MEKYIMIFEGGQHYLADKLTAEDENAVCEGILNVIRCSDQKELLPTGEWQKIPNIKFRIMKNEIKKTSSKWYQEQYDYTLLDPDGWDRKNFDFSFNKELITLEEFNRRLMSSTIFARNINRTEAE